MLDNAALPVWACPSSNLPTNDPAPLFSYTTYTPTQQIPAYIGIMGANPDPAGRCVGSYYNGVQVGTGCPVWRSHFYGYWTNTGMLVPGEKIRIADCTDGTSNTFVVGEQSGVGKNNADMRSKFDSPWGSNDLTTTVTVPNYSIPAVANGPWGQGLTCVFWANNSQSTTLEGANAPDAANTILNSFHPGGINALLSDGSVRFVADSGTFSVFQAMCSRNDSMPTGNF